VTEPRTASEPSGEELVIVGMAGRRNEPPLSMGYDDDDDEGWKAELTLVVVLHTEMVNV